MFRTAYLSFGLAIAFVVAPVASVHALPPGALCDTRPADATLTLGPSVPSVSSLSPNGAYGDRIGCSRWVVDIAVPHTSSGTNSQLRSFTIGVPDPMPDTKAACESTEVRTSFFHKLIGQQQFTLYANTYQKGVWNPSADFFHCTLAMQPGSTPPPQQYNPPMVGTNTYRVARSIKTNGVWKRVQVTAEHQQAPPY